MLRRSALVAAALALTLAGCVGIPLSGGVAVGPAIDDPDNLGVEFLVLGPQDGASQEEILTGFMEALRAPQGNFGTARLFFTKNMATSWDSEKTTIRSGAATTSVADTPNTLAYTITTAAFVDAQGRYSEPQAAAQTLRFGFTQEDGQWRISDAPPGVVLSSSSFNRVFAEQSLYF
ncbi:MAG: hypothetical protein H7226_10430, partial [Salinibacterium sp.]|nr:hypothetical protein [Salinibacterium sp.]